MAGIAQLCPGSEQQPTNVAGYYGDCWQCQTTVLLNRHGALQKHSNAPQYIRRRVQKWGHVNI